MYNGYPVLVEHICPSMGYICEYQPIIILESISIVSLIDGV